MTRILVADDEADLEVLIKQKFRQKIRDNSYEFVFAANGVEALEKLESNHDISIVLSDINMPEMDGLTLLSKINEAHPLIKAVMVSAYGDIENIRVAMNRGAFDFVTKPINFDDLNITVEKTIKHVEQIRKTLQAIKENNILKMYVDENVLKFMSGSEFENSIMSSETIDASVVFIDICGFTSISEKVSADKVVKLINGYFDVMVKEILNQGGHIDKFMGDAVMAVFRGQYHADRAVDAAVAVKNEIMNLPIFDDIIAFVPKVSIGVNSGEVVSGNIGSANLKRLDYTVIGDVVNIAQRLQSNAKENQILISRAVYNQVKESFNCVEVGDISVKNKSKELKVFEVLE